MNKLSKIGLSALCGSLAAVSAANAGSLDVTGGATTTWVSNEGTASGNPLGFSSGIVFKGNGELDNGTTFTLTLSQTDQSAYSNGTIVLDTPSFGKFTINQASGGVGIDVKDDAMPTAWEETDGAGLTTGHDKISGVGASMSVEWKSPTVMGSTISLAYAPHNNGILVNDKGTSGSAGKNRMQGGYDVLLDLNTANAYMLPNIFLGYSSTAQDIDAKTQGTNLDNNQDHEEGVAGAVFSIGPVKFGAQASVEYLGNEQTGTDVWGYRNIAYGISFNVSDNLSLSYGNHQSKKGLQSGTTEGTRVSEAESYQIAYTIGGASIKIAENSVSDQNYVTGTTGDRDGTTVALSLAF
jgi:hypothetical protein